MLCDTIPGETYINVRSLNCGLFTREDCADMDLSQYKVFISWAIVVHTFNPRTGEAETGGSLSLRLAWSTEQVPGQPWIHREALF